MEGGIYTEANWKFSVKGQITLEREKELLDWCDRNSVKYVQQTLNPAGFIVFSSVKKLHNIGRDISWVTYGVVLDLDLGGEGFDDK